MSEFYHLLFNNTYNNSAGLLTAAGFPDFLEDIFTARESIFQVYTLFNTSSYIRPLDCDHAIKSLEKLGKPLTEISRIMNVNDVSVLLIPKRYKLLEEIYSANEQISYLPSLLMEFRSICLDESNQKKHLKNRIQEHFSVLIEAIERVETEAEVILERAILSSSKIYPYH